MTKGTITTVGYLLSTAYNGRWTTFVMTAFHRSLVTTSEFIHFFIYNTQTVQGREVLGGSMRSNSSANWFHTSLASWQTLLRFLQRGLPLTVTHFELTEAWTRPNDNITEQVTMLSVTLPTRLNVSVHCDVTRASIRSVHNLKNCFPPFIFAMIGWLRHQKRRPKSQGACSGRLPIRLLPVDPRVSQQMCVN